MASVSVSASLTAVDRAGGGWRVDFCRLADRYAHRILVCTPESPDGLPILESIEGLPGDPWPPSPPLQDLNLDALRRQASGDRDPVDELQPAMLIGMAGSNNWSVSVEIRPSDTSATLLFDVACRLRSDALPPSLTSSYALAAGVACEVQGTTATLQGPATCHEFQLVESSDDCCGQSRLQHLDGRLSIQHELRTTTSPPLTTRWCYTLRTLAHPPA